MYPFIERCIKLGQTGTCLILARCMGKTVFSGWLLWMHTASLGSFYLAKQECLCGSSPLSVTACHFYPKPSLLSTPIPWPSVSSRFTVGQQNHLAAKYNWPLFWCACWTSIPGSRVGDLPRDVGTTFLWSPDISTAATWSKCPVHVCMDWGW